MMDIPASARANAIPLEVKKDGLRQRQSGDWTLNLVIAATDMDVRLTGAAMGTRYQCVLVEINDDETPVNHVAVDRDKWRDLGPAKQAGIRCKEPIFWAYLSEKHSPTKITDEDAAAVLIRDLCGIGSRADLGKPGHHAGRTLWHQIDHEYQAWKARENA